MPRYIDADALMTDLDQTIRVSAREENGAEMRGIRKVLDRIKAAPTISPDDVRGVGEWIEDAGGNYLVCPECKYDHALYDRLGYSCEHEYCPNCGKRLRLRGVEDGTTDL